MDKKIFATLAIATVLASCTSDLDGINETPANPKPIRRCTAVVDLSVQAPTADATTQTPSDANGPRRASAETADKDTVSLSLPDEYKVHNVVLYLYNAQTGNFADSIHLTHFAGLDKTEHGTMCFRSDSIRLEPGDYRVYAVANAPTAAGKIGNDQSLLTTVAKGKSIMSVIGTEGLTMSNRGGSAQNVRVSTDSVTHIDIALERAVAKVEIGKRYGSYELKDKSGKVYAKVTPGSFYFVNLSRDYYLFRHTGKFEKNITPSRDQYAWSLNNYTDIPDTDGYLIDPHFFDKRWDTSNTFDGSTIFDNALTEIVRTGREYEATLFPEAGSYSKSYILENANFWTAQREGYTTGVIIKGILTPEKSRCFDEHGNNIDPQGVHCLYYFNYNFYTSLAAVKAVGGGNIPSGDISARELETQYNIKYFPIDDKSLYACYYKHFIKHLDNGEKRKLGVMEYGVVSNNWYRVTIADIAGLGSGIINIEPTRPVEEDDILLTDYYVSPWQFRPDDTVLSQPRKK